MTTLQMVEINDEQKERRRRLIAIASEASELAGEGPINPDDIYVPYSALPTWVVMAVERLKSDIEPNTFERLVERFDAIIAEERDSRVEGSSNVQDV